jgi:hypothetical protein
VSTLPAAHDRILYKAQQTADPILLVRISGLSKTTRSSTSPQDTPDAAATRWRRSRDAVTQPTASDGHPFWWQSKHMNARPLGEYEQLLRSTARPCNHGTIVHGSGVIDDLVAGLARHRTTDWTNAYWRRLAPQSAALGCVPWLSDRAVVNELVAFPQCCIVVDKQQPEYAQLRRLAAQGRPLSSAYLEGFQELAPPDEHGKPVVIHPGTRLPMAVDLGPVRVAGWRPAANGSMLPILHAKMLVLGVTTYYEDDEMFAGDVLKFDPKITWVGSANWTNAARFHIEFGMWSTDPALVRHNYNYLLSLLTFSERRGATAIGPEPELVSAVWDNEAFRDYLADFFDPGTAATDM